MRSKIPALAAGCTLLSALSMAPPADAVLGGTGPLISGVYIVNYSETCQAVQVGGAPGKVSTQTLTLTFNPTKHVVTYKGAKVSGALVVWKGLLGGALKRTAVTGSWKFSSTATTLTINGAAFDVAYGPLSNQVPQSMVFGGMSSPDCAASATAILLHAA
jgi:hypothetical protein